MLLIIKAAFHQEAVVPPAKRQLKVATYNLHFESGEDYFFNLERLAGIIGEENPDVVALQEVEVGRLDSQGVDMARWLGYRLGIYVYTYTAEGDHHLMGNAILSRYPVVVHGYDMPSQRQQRTLVHAVIEVDEGLAFDFFCVHVGLDSYDQEVRWPFYAHA